MLVTIAPLRAVMFDRRLYRAGDLVTLPVSWALCMIQAGFAIATASLTATAETPSSPVL